MIVLLMKREANAFVENYFSQLNLKLSNKWLQADQCMICQCLLKFCIVLNITACIDTMFGNVTQYHTNRSITSGNRTCYVTKKRLSWLCLTITLDSIDSRKICTALRLSVKSKNGIKIGAAVYQVRYFRLLMHSEMQH